MTPDQVANAIAKGIAAGNTITNNLLFGLVVVALIILIVVLFTATRTNSALMQFIMSMSNRSTTANERSGAIGQENLEESKGQTKQLENIDKKTTAIGSKVELGLGILELLDVSVDDLSDHIGEIAEHQIRPTKDTEENVTEIADKSASKKTKKEEPANEDT